MGGNQRFARKAFSRERGYPRAPLVIELDFAARCAASQDRPPGSDPHEVVFTAGVHLLGGDFYVLVGKQRFVGDGHHGRDARVGDVGDLRFGCCLDRAFPGFFRFSGERMSNEVTAV